MATLEEQIKKVQDDIKDAKNKIIKFEALPIDHPDRQRLAELDKQENLLQEEKNLLLRERGGCAGRVACRFPPPGTTQPGACNMHSTRMSRRGAHGHVCTGVHGLGCHAST